MTGGQEMHLKWNEHAGANDRFEDGDDDDDDDDNEDPKLDEGNDNNWTKTGGVEIDQGNLLTLMMIPNILKGGRELMCDKYVINFPDAVEGREFLRKVCK